MPRKYTKTSEYWDKFKKPPNNNMNELFAQGTTSEPKFCGSNYYTQADYARVGPKSGESGVSRSNKIFKSTKGNRYANIQEGLLPFEHNASGISVRESIELCQKAYCNVAI